MVEVVKGEMLWLSCSRVLLPVFVGSFLVLLLALPWRRLCSRALTDTGCRLLRRMLRQTANTSLFLVCTKSNDHWHHIPLSNIVPVMETFLNIN